MEVQKISDTIQKFDGLSYYKCGPYFQRKGVRLHRKVWEYHHGAIPDGYDIHHKDGDRTNNSIENLQLLCERDHQSLHMKKPERVERSREYLKKAIVKAREWHSTEDGYNWHSRHAKEYWSNAVEREYACTFCGKKYKTKYVYGKGMNHFCSGRCKAAFRRQRIKNGEIAI